MTKQKILDISYLEKKYILYKKRNQFFLAERISNNSLNNITDVNTIELINMIINYINQVYIFKETIIYNSEIILRFQNRYTKKNIFYKINNSKLEKCNFDYNKIKSENSPIIDCFHINDNEKSNNIKVKKSDKNYKVNSNKVAKRIILTISTVVVTVSISLYGWKYLKTGTIPQIYNVENTISYSNIDDELLGNNDSLENTNFIINSINNNENLTQEEKEFIIQTYAPIWQNNEKYINPYDIASKLNNLKIEYNTNLIKSKKYKDISLLGEYTYNNEIIKTEEEFEENIDKKHSLLKIYGASNFEEVKRNSKLLDTFSHEINHINGTFDYNYSTPLSEGFTELSSPNQTNKYYKYEMFFNIILIETYGLDTIKEGYFNYGLEDAITNKIIENTGEDKEETEINVSNLIYKINYFLNELRVNEENSKDLIESFSKIIEEIQEDYKIINKDDLENNQLILLIIDWFMSTQNSSLNIYQGYRFNNIVNYDINAEQLTVNFINDMDDMKVIYINHNNKIIKRNNYFYTIN